MAFNARMHERNIYKKRPNFAEIALEYPEFRKYAVPDERGKIHVDFADPDALRLVTKLLLKKDFNLNVEIPLGFLIPTIPQRLNYILWIEDLLSILSPKDIEIRGLDIGTGPCAIFSLLGAKKNHWKFVSTESSDEAITWANANIEANNLQSYIKVIKVKKDSILDEVLSTNEDTYDFCLCNPPFFGDVKEIKKKNVHVKETIAKIAKEDEIVAEGGEVAFVHKMVLDSLLYKDKIRLYTSMFGKKKSFLTIQKEIKLLKDVTFTTTEFCQGNTIRWGIAWTFLKSIEFIKVKKPKSKEKQPLVYKIPETNKITYSVKKIFNEIKHILSDLEIQISVLHCSEKVAVLEMKSDINTWSHQRRKRRELLREKKLSSSISNTPSTNSSLLHSSDPNILISERFNQVQNEQDIEICDTSTDSVSVFHLSSNSDSCSKISGKSSQELESKNELFSKNPGIQEEFIPGIIKTTASSLQSDCLENTAVTNSAPIVKIFDGNEGNHSSESSEFISSSNYEAKTGENRTANEIVNHNCEKTLTNNEIDCSETLTISQRDKRKNEFETEPSSSSKKIKIDSNFHDEANIKHKFLLYCSLKVIKAKDSILMEMNCPSGANRDTMHQVFQFAKNKIVTIKSFS